MGADLSVLRVLGLILIIVFAGFMGRTRAPAALGQPFERN